MSNTRHKRPLQRATLERYAGQGLILADVHRMITDTPRGKNCTYARLLWAVKRHGMRDQFVTEPSVIARIRERGYV